MARQGITFEVGANTRAYNRAMDNIKNVTSNTARNIAGIFGIGLGFTGVTMAATRFIEKLDQIGDTAKKFGISTDFLQKLSFASEKTGTDLGTIENAIKRMQKTIFDAQGGVKAATDNFGLLGLTFDDLRGKSPEEQFRTIATALNLVTDATEKSALAQKIFGRSGTDLIPLIKEYNTLSKEAESRGIISEETIKNAEILRDRFVDIKTAIAALIAKSGVFDVMAKGLENLIKTLGEIKNAKNLEKKGEVKTRTVQKGFDYVASPAGAMIKVPHYEEEIYTDPITKGDLKQSKAEKEKRLAGQDDQLRKEKEMAIIRQSALKQQGEERQRDITVKTAETLQKKLDEENYSLSLLKAKNALSEQDFEVFKINTEYERKIKDAKDEQLKSIYEKQRTAELTQLSEKHHLETEKLESEKLKTVREELLFMKAKKALSEKDFEAFKIKYETAKELYGVQDKELRRTIEELGGERLNMLDSEFSTPREELPIRGIFSSPVVETLKEDKTKTLQERSTRLLEDIKLLVDNIEKKNISSVYS